MPITTLMDKNSYLILSKLRSNRSILYGFVFQPGTITGMMKRINSDEAIRITVSLLLGGLLAWLLKDIWAPWILAGGSFSQRSLYVKILLVGISTVFFSLAIRGIIRINDSINDQSIVKPRNLLAILGGCTGALIFYLVYGTGTLDTGRVDWLFNLGDNAQHYLGWVFYRNDPWMFPIGFSCSLGYPTGTCMCFTDSIPLIAIPLKLISFLLPATFQYFGWWTLLNFVLQGAFAALILYEVSRRRLAALIAPLFFCLADIFLFRVFRYTPLSGQWIVLFAIYLYFLNKKDEQNNHLWPLVHGMAVLIQGYFFVMTFVIFCGTLLERYLKDRKILPILKEFAISLGSTAILMWLVGFFTASVDMSDEGLGYFKANLNAFFNPLSGWSRFFSPLPLAEGTYPLNVNYLGLGIILLFLLGLVSWFFWKKKSLRQILVGNIGLFIIIPVLVIFALSNVVTFNDRILFSYTLPEPLLRLWGVFRGTERMLWPVFYLVFIFAISQTVNISRRNWVGGLILLAAFGVQLTEVMPQLQRFHTEFAEPQGKQTTLKSDFWSDAASQFNSVVILPLSLQNWDRLTQYAAENHMRINYSYYARYSPSIGPAAAKKEKELKNGDTLTGEMYIIKSPELLHSVCQKYGRDAFLAYVNQEWVLAPGFSRNPMDYPDISITGTNSNCLALPLDDFITKYQDKILVLSVMKDVSTLANEAVNATLRNLGLETGLLSRAGMSFAAVLFRHKVQFVKTSEQKVEFSAQKGNSLSDSTWPIDLHLVSAGEISGEEQAVIEINHRDYSYHQNGLNLVVVDPATGSVIDTALFSPTEP